MNKSIEKVRDVTRGVVATVAGVMVTDKKDFIRLAAHSADKLLKGDFSSALTNTYVYFINQGKIDKKYFGSREFADLAPELQTVDEEMFSIEQLDVLRKIFVNLALDQGTNSHKKYLLDIAIQMSEPEIKILVTDYKIATGEIKHSHGGSFRMSAHDWLNIVAENSGLRHSALVDMHEEKLIDKRLLTNRAYGDRSGVAYVEGRSRLTGLGRELVEYMMLSDDPLSEQAKR